MKYGRILGIVTTIAVMLAAMIVPASPVLAAGTISLSKSTGPVGTTVTVSGTGFTDGVNYFIFFTDNHPFGPFTATGNTLVASIDVPVIARSGSANLIYVKDAAGSVVSNSAYFTITPQVVLGAGNAKVGDSVSVFGNGFYADVAVSIYFDNSVVGTVNTDSDGSFDSGSFIVPQAYRGAHTVRGKDTEFSPAVSISIASKVIISPSSGGAGDKISVTGSGFTANSQVSFYWDDSIISGTSATSDVNGGFTIPSLQIPASSKGSHTIKAEDANSNSANVNFNIAQKITLSPSSAVSGTTVTVSGSGFDTDKTITIKYNSSPVTTTGPVNTGTTGAFSTNFIVPAGYAGPYTVEASDGTNLATATFNAVVDAQINPVTTKDKPGFVGEDVTLTGMGFRPNVTVNIYFASEPVQIGNVTTDNNGLFTATVKIPTSNPGDHTITITDGATIKQFPFVIESQAPAAPSLLLPTPDGKQDAAGQFTWEPVTDPSGVTYTIQIALDKDFTKIFLEKKGLTQPSYTLTDQEKLSSNNSSQPYYWRVKAVDGTGLDSGWSAAQPFNVGFVFELAAWMIWIAAILGGILLFLMGFLLGRKTAVL